MSYSGTKAPALVRQYASHAGAEQRKTGDGNPRSSPGTQHVVVLPTPKGNQR